MHEFPLKDITVAGQEFLNPEKLREYTDHLPKVKGKPPRVILRPYGDNDIAVADGHHTIAGARARGDTHIRAKWMDDDPTEGKLGERHWGAREASLTEPAAAALPPLTASGPVTDRERAMPLVTSGGLVTEHGDELLSPGQITATGTVRGYPGVEADAARPGMELPDPDSDWFTRFENPLGDDTSNMAFGADGTVGVALHPARWDWGTLAHEAAHHLTDHQTSQDPFDESATDADKHGPDFARNYATALETVSKGAGEDFARHHADAVALIGNYRARIHGLPRELDAPSRHEAVRNTGPAPFPNPYHGTEQFGGNPDWHETWFHGTPGEPDFRERHPGDPSDQRRLAVPPDKRPVESWRSPNGMLGVHFSPLHSVAHSFAMPHFGYRSPGEEGHIPGGTGSVTHARLRFDHPAHFSSEDHLHAAIARWADEHYPGWHDPRLNARLAGSYSDTEGTHKDWQARHPEGSREAHSQGRQAVYVLSWHPHLPEIARGFTEHLRSEGRHGITYANAVEGPYGSVSAIATHPSQIESASVEHIAPHHSMPGPHETSWEASGELNEPPAMEDAIERAHTGAGKGDYTTYPRVIQPPAGYQAEAALDGLEAG